MANFTETDEFEPNIYKLATVDALAGGDAGKLNTATQQLANRTKNLDRRVRNMSNFNVKDYGALGDSNGTSGGTDDTAAIQAAIDAAAAVATNNPVVYFPPCTGYRVTAAIVVPANVSVVMDGPIIYTGSSDIAVLTVGATNTNTSTRKYKLHVKRNTISTWSDAVDLWKPETAYLVGNKRKNGFRNYTCATAGTSALTFTGPTGTSTGITDGTVVWDYTDVAVETNIGVRIYGANQCQIELVEINGFTVGCQLIGAGKGTAYNTVNVGGLINNKIGLDLTNVTSGGIGWCNENVIIGGRFTVNSGVNTGKIRYGVRITSQDGTYVGNNNNVFNKPSFEMGSASLGTGMLFEYADLNRVYSVRSEGNLTVAEFRGASTENIIESGYISDAAPPTEVCTYATNLVTGGRTKHYQLVQRLVFSIDDLVSRYTPYSAASISVPGMAWGNSSNGNLAKSNTSYAINADSIQYNSGRTLGVKIDTTVAKTFAVTRTVTDSASGGRFEVRCYDASGVQLSPVGFTGTPLLRASSGASLTAQSQGGGSYGAGADSNGQVFFTLSDQVKSIWVGVGGGTAQVKMRGLSVWTDYSGPRPNVTAGYAGETSDLPVVTASPAFGTWSAGRMFFNDAPSAGAPAGWICTTAGTPGTWRVSSYVEGLTQATVTGATGTVLATSGYVPISRVGAVALTLPASTYTGPGFRVKDISGTCSPTNVITFVAGSGTTVEAAYELSEPYDSITWYLDGTIWRKG